MSAEGSEYPIVILGGGFAGAYCARALAAEYKAENIRTTALVSDQNAMLFHPMLAEVSGASISPLDVVNPLRIFCRNTSFYLGAVREIDLERRILEFSPGPFVREATLQFEHLVLALGSIVDVSRVPGMAEHGNLMKNVGDAIRLRTEVLQRLEEAAVSPDQAVRRRLLTFLVVGGGYSGVETIGQLVDLIRGVIHFYPRIDYREMRFVLVHSGPFLLPQIGEELGRYCEHQLQRRGVEVRLNQRVTAITAERAILGEHGVVETNTVVTTVGNTTNPIIKNLIDKYRLASEHGRLTTEPTLQVKGYNYLWAVGDCAAVPDSNGQISPATAQFAMRQGSRLGKNLINLRQGRSLIPFHYQSMGEMASLGHRNAVGKVLGVKVSGLLGWLMWRATYLYKLPGLERKLKVFLEWNLDLIFPRDISLLDARETRVLGRMHSEPGDPIYHVGDPAFSFYLIEKGKVQIVEGQEQIRVLGPGQHFGERELLQNIRRQSDATAIESTSLVFLDRNTFEALAQNSFALGYLLSRSSVRYLTLDERMAIANRVPESIRVKRVSEFIRPHTTVIEETQKAIEALTRFRDAKASMLVVVDEENNPKGWLRLDAVLDYLHQGRAKLESPIRDLIILPAETTTPEETIGSVLLRFARTPDREFLVLNGGQKLVGTLAVVDIILAAQQSLTAFSGTSTDYETKSLN
jgi:NADH:ubiquinone reductase (H+-translocating)